MRMHVCYHGREAIHIETHHSNCTKQDYIYTVTIGIAILVLVLYYGVKHEADLQHHSKLQTLCTSCPSGNGTTGICIAAMYTSIAQNLPMHTLRYLYDHIWIHHVYYDPYGRDQLHDSRIYSFSTWYEPDHSTNTAVRQDQGHPKGYANYTDCTVGHSGNVPDGNANTNSTRSLPERLANRTGPLCYYFGTDSKSGQYHQYQTNNGSRTVANYHPHPQRLYIEGLCHHDATRM